MGSSGVAATVSTPVTIQNMTSSYVTITSHVLKAFDLWEQAEALARKNKGEGLCGTRQRGRGEGLGGAAGGWRQFTFPFCLLKKSNG